MWLIFLELYETHAKTESGIAFQLEYQTASRQNADACLVASSSI